MLMTVDEVAAMITGGAVLSVAGDEALLARLPAGKWIGGTSTYFMSGEGGGAYSRDRLLVQDLGAHASETLIRFYDPSSLAQIAKDSPEHGFSVVVIAGMSTAHARFVEDEGAAPALAARQIVGWASGVDLADLGKAVPKIFDGSRGEHATDGAIVLHCSLPAGKRAKVAVVDMFEPGEGDALSFELSGFAVSNCLVNGERKPFAEYLAEKQVDTRLPLVASVAGEQICVGIQYVDLARDKVSFYAPVVEGVTYRAARPLEDYVATFEAKLPAGETPIFATTSILHYLYAGLEGKVAGSPRGPVSFAEIAHSVRNQTVVYLTLVDG